VLKNFHDRVNSLKNNGFQVLETDLFEDIDALEKAHHDICSWQFAETHDKLVERYSSHYSSQSFHYILKGMRITPRSFSTRANRLLRHRDV
jgi:hypothetical protein